MSHHIAFTMAALSCSGGIYGFVRKASKPSLIAGVAFGAAFATSGYLIKNNKDFGMEIASGSSLLLLAAMLPRAIKTRQPVPILMASIGTLGVCYYGKKLYEQENGI